MLDTKAIAQATATIVREHVSAAVEPLLARISALEARELATPEKGDRGEAGQNGADGKDADPEIVRALVSDIVSETLPAAVEAAVSALPAPEKGEKGDVGDRGEQGPAGNNGRDGADGVGLSDAMIDRSGELIVTMTDGRIKNLGPVLGRDGKDGERGEAGADGRDGRDLDDLSVTQDGSTVEFAFQVGDVRSIFEIELPTGPAGQDGRDAYPGEAKGLFDPNETYRAMDVVSFNGSEWRAKQDDPGEIPGAGWMLSATKGKRGDRGEPGKAGRDGATAVAQYLRGSELITTLSDGAELTADLAALRRADSDDQ